MTYYKNFLKNSNSFFAVFLYLLSFLAKTKTFFTDKFSKNRYAILMSKAAD